MLIETKGQCGRSGVGAGGGRVAGAEVRKVTGEPDDALTGCWLSLGEVGSHRRILSSDMV